RAPRGFPKDQAFVGIGGEDPAAAPFLRQRRVIGLRIEGEHRELEPALSFRLAVAAGGVAAVAAQDRQDVVFKMEGRIRGGGRRRKRGNNKWEDESHGP